MGHVYLLQRSPKPLLTVLNLKYSIIMLETELLVFVYCVLKINCIQNYINGLTV